jgi:hypothetical protein
VQQLGDRTQFVCVGTGGDEPADQRFDAREQVLERGAPFGLGRRSVEPCWPRTPCAWGGFCG